MLLEATLIRHSGIDFVLPKQVSDFEHFGLYRLFEVQEFVNGLSLERVLDIELVEG